MRNPNAASNLRRQFFGPVFSRILAGLARTSSYFEKPAATILRINAPVLLLCPHGLGSINLPRRHVNDGKWRKHGNGKSLSLQELSDVLGVQHSAIRK